MLGPRGRTFAPQVVNENVTGDGLVRPEKENREQRPLLQAADLDRTAVGADLERSEKPVVNHWARTLQTHI